MDVLFKCFPASQIICIFYFSVPCGRVSTKIVKEPRPLISSPVLFILPRTIHRYIKARDASPFFSFQNTFLQETVRRECEERFELTEALSQAREQLLELRRLSGSLPVTPRFLSPGSLTASAAGHQGERSLAKLNSERGTKIPGLNVVSKPSSSPTSAQPKRANSSGLPSLQPHPPRGRASSINENRQRLAALLRRKLNQP